MGSENRKGPYPVTIRSNFPEQITEIEDLGIPMPDGTRLSARVWMPAGAATKPVPAVLEYIPYRKRDGTLARDELMHPYVAGHGYACVRVDIRGNGDTFPSGGSIPDVTFLLPAGQAPVPTTTGA